MLKTLKVRLYTNEQPEGSARKALWGIQRNHHIAKSVTDQGWYQFETMLTYKMEWRNAELIEIGRFDPSSKMCSKCGNMKHDLNAAINILHMGLIKVGKNVGSDIPELTPVESATAAELLNRGGLRVATL